MAGVLVTVLIIVQAVAITNIVVPVFTEGAALAQVSGMVWLLALVVVGRVLLAYIVEFLSFRSAAAAKSELRLGVVHKVMDLGPVWMSHQSGSEITQVLTRGIDGLDAYFSKYLPQLVLSVCLPIALWIVILTQDVIAAVIIICTLPLIPVFMILIGLYTQNKVDRQWNSLGLLSSHFVDLVAGMPTLKIFGRAKAQAKNVQEIGDRYRSTTMGVLRVSFLSSLVLELLAMISVALVAVSIGLRLVEGNMSLSAGLLVLILAPEVYWPIRQVGAHFHAAAEGLGAAQSMMEILEEEDPHQGERPVDVDLGSSVIRFTDVAVRYPGSDSFALGPVSLDIQPRKITTLVGSSGCGKTTLLNVLERFVEPESGVVGVVESNGAATSIDDFEVRSWRAEFGYVEQSPRLIPGTVWDNVRLINPDATDDQVNEALVKVQMAEVVEGLPDGRATRLGEGGRLLSVGQIQRIALARVLVSTSPIVLFDEPTSALDGPTEELILGVIRELAVTRTIVVVAHSQALVEIADVVVDLSEVFSH